MLTTPASLLYRLRNREELEAWPKFVDLYSPLLYRWANQLGHQDADAADLIQDVFVILWQKLPEFSYNADQSFHAWLKTVFLNRFRSRMRQRIPVAIGMRLEVESKETIEPSFDDEDLEFLTRQAFRVIECEFPQMYRDVFLQYVIQNGDADEVAKRFHISLGTVYSIKSKVLSRLRQTLKDLAD